MPRFEHDCERCIWLGQVGEYDLYFCEQMGPESRVKLPTIVARFGDDGPQYLSGRKVDLELPEAAKATVTIELHPEEAK